MGIGENDPVADYDGEIKKLKRKKKRNTWVNIYVPQMILGLFVVALLGKISERPKQTVAVRTYYSAKSCLDSLTEETGTKNIASKNLEQSLRDYVQNPSREVEEYLANWEQYKILNPCVALGAGAGLTCWGIAGVRRTAKLRKKIYELERNTPA